MIFNPRIASVPEPGVVEAATSPVIVSNFDKGLMLVRCMSGPAAPPRIAQTPIRAPRLSLLTEAMPPRNGLLLSILLHSAAVPVLLVLPILVPTRAITASDAANYPDSDLPADAQPIFLPLLPETAEANLSAEARRAVGASAHRFIPVPLKSDYAGPQEIVSAPPDAMHGVQTIRRLDLVSPPKMTYPLRLPSMVIRPAQALRAPVAPRIEPSLRINQSESLMTFVVNQPAPPKPRLAIDTKSLSLAPKKREVPKTADAFEPSLPGIAAPADPQATPLKSVVVINAVIFPPKPDLVIPDARMDSRFVVEPSRDATAEIEPRTIQGARSFNRGDGKERGAEHLDSLAGSAKSRSLNAELRTDPRDRSGSTDSTVTTGENKGLAGISISGGVPGRSGRALTTSSFPRGSYGLTVISDGNSGGAGRDLGVFARTDTVYTIYIPMTDVGGADWSMQYALASPLQNSSPNALLTPPVVLKKVPAIASGTDLTANSGPVFVAGTIDENGELRALRAVRTMEAQAPKAMNALAQWEFQPAQLAGKPVATKVLIGVKVMPAKEDGKQQP